MSRLLTIADSKIPFAEEAFSVFGNVEVLEKEAILPERLRSADILLVRSETRVDAELLQGSRVQFVGSPTSGTDHVDFKYLHAKKIAFAHAPGSNARSVAEYVLAAMLLTGQMRGQTLRGKTLGVVGLGNIGSLVAEIGSALGMRVLRNDPPLQFTTGTASFVHLDELSDADFVTLHVPLTHGGRFPTWHLFDEKNLNKLNPECVLINSARGAVVENTALKKVIAGKGINTVVLDVWEGEPAIDCELLNMVTIATPHIAGYSWDGKAKGTNMVFQAACEYFGVESAWLPSEPATDLVSLGNLPNGSGFDAYLSAVVRRFYDITTDDHNLRQISKFSVNARSAYFSTLRKSYRTRREFSSQPLHGNERESAYRNVLQQLGFEFLSPPCKAATES